MDFRVLTVWCIKQGELQIVHGAFTNSWDGEKIYQKLVVKH